MTLLLLFSLPVGMSYAADQSALVKAWLKKMVKAEHSVSYRGTFVYRYSDEMVAMSIVRAKGDHGMLERLSSLNGSQGEVMRNSNRVRCLIPNSVTPLISDTLQTEKGKVFASLNERIDQIDRYYELSLAGVTRVVGRKSQKIVITPRDEHRYGYQIWIDQQSGLLLKSKHLTVGGEVLEQMVYSNIEIFGEELPPSVRQLLIENMADSAVGKRVSNPQVSGGHLETWTVSYIPSGFKLANYHRRTDVSHAPFEHIAFSDGLASVSVFIEKQEANNAFRGVSQRGAMNAYLAALDDYQIVVMGEVPLETLELMGQSVRHTVVSSH